MLVFVHLPEDIFLSILSFLPPQSILSLGQTCRYFHAFTSADYLWHQIRTQLPLDLLDPNLDIDLNQISGLEMRKSFVRALRVEFNWQRTPSRLKELTRIIHGDIVFHMQFISSAWLITLSRDSRTYLSVWHVSNPQKSRRVACIETPCVSRFSAVLREDGKQAIVAADSGRPGNEIVMAIYAIPLDLDAELNTSGFSVIVNVTRQDLDGGVVSEIHATGTILAAGVANFGNIMDPPTYRILLIDTTSGAQLLIDPETPEMHFRIGEKFLIVSFIRQKKLVLRVHDSANIIQQLLSCQKTDKLLSVGEALAEHETPPLPFDPLADYLLSAETLGSDFTHITSLSFHEGLHGSSRSAYVFRFPLRRGSLGQHLSVRRFSTRATIVTAQMPCFGNSGRRAVWLEHQWDDTQAFADQYFLMKATFSSDPEEQATIGSLLDQSVTLPFEMYTCRSIAFHEATGRICLGLHTGDLYMMQL